MRLTDLQANGNTTVLTSALQDYGITPAGAFEADIKRAVLEDNAIETIDGNIQFQSLVLSGVLRVAIGDVNSTFSPQTDHTQIDITNQNGHLDLVGDIQLYTDKRYQLDMQFRENNKTDQTIINGLQYFSKKQNNGTYRLVQNGSL